MDLLKQLFQGEWWQWVFSGVGPAVIGIIFAVIVFPLVLIMRRRSNSHRITQRTGGGDAVSIIAENNSSPIVGIDNASEKKTE